MNKKLIVALDFDSAELALNFLEIILASNLLLVLFIALETLLPN